MKMTWLGRCVGAGGRWMCRILDEADMSYGCRRETESQHTVAVQTQKNIMGLFGSLNIFKHSLCCEKIISQILEYIHSSPVK